MREIDTGWLAREQEPGGISDGLVGGMTDPWTTIGDGGSEGIGDGGTQV